jgi:ABC-type Co2+ transport system permease subunit
MENNMHIEPGLVSEAKLVLSYATAAASIAYAAKLATADIKERGLMSLSARIGISTVLVFLFFEVLPHFPIGVSEVHLILGSTLFLVFGAAPAALGLMLGLLVQGVFFAPQDLAQYSMNVTTLLVPLFGLQMLAAKVIPSKMAYVDLQYRQAFMLSTAYQGGIVAWVAFWAIYGQGFGAANISSIATFGLSYMLVVLIEPAIDLGVLAIAKLGQASSLTSSRLHATA